MAVSEILTIPAQLLVIVLLGSGVYGGYLSDPETGLPMPCVTGKTGAELARDRAMSGYVGAGLSPEDPELLNRIQEHFLEKPRPFIQKLSMKVKSTPQADTVNKLLRRKTNGFFVECGAFDGERSSNTLWLEAKKGWTGLLIEQDPSYYMQLRGKNRKVTTVNVCLGSDPFPTKKDLAVETWDGGSTVLDTYCFPLYSLMLALNRTRIDYFSLDVEGLELSILKTIPFDKLDIAVLTVEYIHGQPEQEYVDFMQTKGYKMVEKLDFYYEQIYLRGNDLVFLKKELVR